MIGIQPHLYYRLRQVLLAVHSFEDDVSLEDVFLDTRLLLWRNYVPSATTRDERIVGLIDFLYDQYNAKGENALVIFLRILAEQHNPADDLHYRLKTLAEDLRDHIDYIARERHPRAQEISSPNEKWSRHYVISPALAQQLRTTLRNCTFFINESVLQSIFVDARIAIWRQIIPHVSSVEQRIDAIIETLVNQFNAEGENALVLFLYVLCDLTDTNDALHNRLLELAKRIEYENEVSSLDKKLAYTLTSDLHHRLCVVLNNSDVFDSNRSLSSLFVDIRISHWRNLVPQASTKKKRIDVVINTLSNRYNASGENALVLFLKVLREWTDPTIPLCDELDPLIQTIVDDIQISTSKHLETFTNREIAVVGDNVYIEGGIHFYPETTTELNFSAHELTEIPSEVWETEQLRRLDLSRNDFKVLPAEIGQLVTLQALNLSDIGLTTFPQAITLLTDLQTLDLSRNQLSELISEIAQLTALRELNLSHNQLESLPPELGQLSQLQILNLNNNEHLNTLPPEIEKLTTLWELDLSNNQLENLPSEIGQLTALRTLDLSNNRLTTLPPELAKLTRLRRLDLRGNPISIPPEILDRTDDPVIIFDYWNRLTDAVTPLNEAKMIVVGNASVGKTSLVQRLIYDKFDEQLSVITNGITVNAWNLELASHNPTEDRAQQICINVWNFGGQEIMRATHQFFMTQRTLYLLVLDSRVTEADNQLDYWLTLIRSFGGNSPIIVVGNKVDRNPLNLDRRKVLAENPTIQAVLETSCITGSGIAELRDTIGQAIMTLPHVSEQWPNTWLRVKSKLEELKVNTLSLVDYVRLCEAQGITDSANQQILLSLLHDLGAIIHFTDPRLEDTAILNPEWLTQGVYRILNSRLVFEAQGILKQEILTRILDDTLYLEKRLFILNMMQKFELCYEMPDQPNTYLIPDLLPRATPDTGSWDGALQFEYHYSVLPSSILTRLIVRMQRYIYDQTVWRTGVLFSLEDNQALVQADISNNRINIAVRGSSGRRELLAVIRSHLNDIHAVFPSLSVSKKMPIPGHPGVPPVDYDWLLELERKGISEFIPPRLDESVNVHSLLNGAEPSSTRQGNFIRLEDIHVNKVAVVAQMNIPGTPQATKRGIPAELLAQLRNTLSRCASLESDNSLRAVFVDSYLDPQWEKYIPTTTSRTERINELINALFDVQDDEGNNALLLFLKTTAVGVTSDAPYYADLINLTNELDAWQSGAQQRIEQAIGRQATELDLSGLGLTIYPANIEKLTALQKLNLANNALTTLPPEIGRLRHLRHLDLGHNRLSSFPPEMLQLRHLEVLDVRGNVLPLPDEIIAHPSNAASILDAYFQERHPLNEIKLILVGEGYVGKTSLVKRLKGEDFDQNEPMTEGIIVKRHDEIINGEEFRLNIWDFGGQQHMRAPHQFFLTHDSLYLAVIDTRTGERELDYWLQIIRSYTDTAPIIVVINKADVYPFVVDRVRLRHKYKVSKFITTSCADENHPGIGELRQAIKDEIYRMDHARQPWPKAWLKVKADLEAKEDSNYLSNDEYVDICVQAGVLDYSYQRQLLASLHKLGTVLNYSNISSQTNILNPDWVIRAIYAIINARQIAENAGILVIEPEHPPLGSILTDSQRYPYTRHRFILELMQKFKLGFYFGQPAEGFEDESASQKYLVPDLLPKDEILPENWPAPDETLNFQYRFNILPNSLITQFIVHVHPYIYHDRIWRTGAHLHRHQSIACVSADLSANVIHLSFCGDFRDRYNFLTLIDENLRQIHRPFRGVVFTRHVRIPGYQNVYEDYDYLMTLEQLGFEDFVPHGLAQRIALRPILDGIAPPELRGNVAISGVRDDLVKQLQQALADTGYCNDIKTLRDQLQDTPVSSWAGGISEVDTPEAQAYEVIRAFYPRRTQTGENGLDLFLDWLIGQLPEDERADFITLSEKFIAERNSSTSYSNYVGQQLFISGEGHHFTFINQTAGDNAIQAGTTQDLTIEK